MLRPTERGKAGRREGGKAERNVSRSIFQPSSLPPPVATGTSAFTVTELLIVLTLIGILSAISMPALKGFVTTRRLKASAYTLRSLLTFARDMAVTDQTTHLVVFDFDNNRYWLASSETFDPSNPLTSTLTAQNSTAVAAAQNNINRNSGLQTLPTAGTSASQVPLARSSGILGVPYSMEQHVTLATMVTNHNGRTVQVDSGVAYIYFSPTSTSEDAFVYLRNTRNQIMSVTVEAASGRVRVRQLTSQEIEMLGFETADSF